MKDTRKKDSNWYIRTNPNGNTPSDDAHLAVLMDIRDELKALNAVIGCVNFIRIPQVPDKIQRNTAKPKRKKRAAA